MPTKEQCWQVLLYISGVITASLIGVFTYVYGPSILILGVPTAVFFLLVSTVLNRTARITREQLLLTNRHVEELTHYIEHQKQANSLIEQSEAQFRNSFDFAAVGMALSSSSGKIIKVNHTQFILLSRF